MITTIETVQPPRVDSPVADSSSIPESLIYETLNGRPLYYRGYRDVIAGTLKSEDLMGSSDLQSILVSLINTHITINRDKKQYITATNESGLHLGVGDNLSADIALFEKAKLSKLKGKYFDIAPKIVIEVDIKIDLNAIGSDVAYISEKTQELFSFGVERVLWVLSSIRKVIILHPNQDWITTDWSNDITVMEGCVLNIKNLLDEEEISY
ncbi:Uma2 family endonuclease [Spirosoma sp. HMF3257]|uniref:Uma2 family endonuclease n=1 Tax=Spirosoma telluris TaxID=2183553 RepID=A0A327NLK2_9BACT|nr:Uma2 family endonuclease [Spirosoma telluris]RAI75239.1 Uma2 family endonuclease [Spirosoma telluris]